MSHLAHIVKLKERLSTEGVTCPIEQQSLVCEGYVRALIRFHMEKYGNFILAPGVEEQYWVQLNKWNRVNPFKAAKVMAEFTNFLNSTRRVLINKGTLPVEEPSIKLEDGTTKCLCSFVEFQDLVGWLVKEVRECDE